MVRILGAVRLAASYCFARFLPSSNHFGGGGIRVFRRWICRGLFKRAGKEINVEQGAYFGDGSQLEIGDYSGIGVNALVIGPVTIGKGVMMASDVVILTSNHRFDRTDIPMWQLELQCAY
ncbi:MAG TPA: hypothetical protein PKY77_14235 [Phycisphaerae bacterium]|nr:hypothetical protein [Phycisphaerae bacterium]HRY66799.1 hypothetical protein [Phycisphaerae bacterium]